ncbi:MAG: hypothetical protein ABI787_06870 [Spartobacteria bacterium]
MKTGLLGFAKSNVLDLPALFVNRVMLDPAPQHFTARWHWNKGGAVALMLPLMAKINLKFAAAHNWKRYLAALSLGVTALAMTGCGVQLGEFFSSGVLCYSLKPSSGLISIERGNRWFHRRAVDGNLFCVLVLAPTLRFQTGPSFINGSFTSSRRFYWNSDSGPVTLSYDWNRLSDSVNIDGYSFSREKGNAFVVCRSPDQKWSVRQIAGVPSTADARAVVRHFQRNLPNDDFAPDLSLLPAHTE